MTSPAVSRILCIILSTAPWISGFKVIDLSHLLNSQSASWPPNPPFNFTIMFRDYFFDDQWLENNKFCMPEHMGTHLDAPAHFGRKKWRVQDIPIEKLIGPGVIVNIKEKVENNKDYLVSIADMKEWEKMHGKIPEGAIVLMNSGWDKYVGDDAKVWGSQDISDTTSYHFPGWHEDTVMWLIKKRKINIVGVDVPSVDYGQSRKYRAHATAAANNIPMLENVANLDSVPPTGSIIYANVIKLEDGSGGPTRVIATIGSPSGSACVKTTCLLFLFCLYITISVMI